MPAIVMVHGAFCGGWAFETFKAPFERAGFEVATPDLRGHGEHEPGDRVIGVSMNDYADDVAALCRSLAEPPVLIGHSMGGLVCQMAARRTPVAALALLAPSPPWGVAGWSIEEAITAFGIHFLSPFTTGAIEPDRALMRRLTLDRLSREEARPIAARARPESARAVREVLNWWLDPFMTTSIGPGPLQTPALVVTGDADRIHPIRTVRRTAERIGAEFVCMPGMSHWLTGEPGWEAVADLVLQWLAGEARVAA